jgi:hypothetical protein
MAQSDLQEYINGKVNANAQKILDKSDAFDEVAVGALNFYTALRQALAGKLDKKELGLLDAINDTLQELKIIESGKTFYK